MSDHLALPEHAALPRMSRPPDAPRLPELMERLRERLLVQCRPDEALAALTLARQRGGGVVVSTYDRRDVRALAAVAHGTPLLVDAGRYAGTHRRPAGERFDPTWISVQREAGLPVLTDSGHIAAHDHAGLRQILDAAARIGDAIATLPLDPWWLDGGLGELVERIGAAGVPVAVALEHTKDPLGVRKTLAGLLELLRAGVPVVLLRSDVSGLGLLCHGAWAAAVGTRTSLRHYHPPSRPGGGGRPASIATVVPECLAFVAVDRIALAVQADPDDSLWQPCLCSACRGHQLDWIATLDGEAERQRAASTHAFESLFGLHDHLLRGSGTARKASWRAHCDNALARYAQLGEGSQEWGAPAFLRHWSQVPIPASAR